MPKFKVEVTYEVTEVYEIEAKDADFARIKATNIYPYAPIDRRVSDKRVESITQVSPRYVVSEERGYDDIEVFDTKMRMRVALCYSKGIADMLVKQLNEEEEAE